MVSITDAYVDGRPIPRSSSSFTRLASVKRAGGWVAWPDGRSSRHATAGALVERRQDRLAVLELGVGIVGALDVRAEVAGELDRAARGLEGRLLVGGRGCRQPERDPPDAGVGHLRRDGALPDEVVEATFVAATELAVDVVDGAHGVARRTDRLVRLLRVLHLAAVLTGLVGEVRLAVHRADLVACRARPPAPRATWSRSACR